MLGKLTVAALTGCVLLSGCTEAISASSRSRASAAAAPACPAEPTDPRARTRFVAAASPAFTVLRDNLVTPIGSGRGADVVVRTEAVKAASIARSGLTTARTAVLADPVLCHALGARLTSLLDALRTVQGSLADRPDVAATKMLGVQAKALKTEAARLGIVGLGS